MRAIVLALWLSSGLAAAAPGVPLRGPLRLAGGAGARRVSLRVDDPALRRRLLERGGRAYPGGVIYAELSPRELAELTDRSGDVSVGRLTDRSGIVAVEAARRLAPALDRSRPRTGAVVARDELGLDGRGVVIGIVDTGCDFRHLDLRDEAGRTRLVALADVTLPPTGRHPELLPFRGAVYLADEIDGALREEGRGDPGALIPSRDLDGHGTHLAGIAAGGGRATGAGLAAGRYLGMAPGARLICVQAADDGHTFAEEDVLAGVRLVGELAGRLGLPAVVNLSLSGEGGPHDGTTNFERALEALVPASQPGRALVVAAGNAGQRDLHAGGFALDGRVEVRIQVGRLGSDGRLVLELWFSGPPPALSVIAPAGRSFGPVGPGRGEDGSLGAQVVATIDNAKRGVDPANHRYEAQVAVSGALAEGTWRLVLEGQVERWDAWLLEVPRSAATPRFVSHLDVDTRALTPAFVRSAISVGAEVSRSDWITSGGRMVTRSSVVGRLAAFSGTGPTADGRFLPDLVAPGEYVAAALSRHAPPSLPGSAFYSGSDGDLFHGDDGVHGLLRGTSQAAPHVAGAAALLLQLEPGLTGARLRELLRTAATVEPGAAGFSPKGGFGRLDVAAAARLLRRRPTGPLDAALSSVGVSRDLLPPGGLRSTVTVVPRDGGGAPLGPGHRVTILARDAARRLDGEFAGPVIDLGEGRYERELLASGPAGAALRIAVTVDEQPLAAAPTVFLAGSRGAIGQGGPGGCAVAPGPRRPPPLVVVVLIAALLLRATRRRRSSPKQG